MTKIYIITNKLNNKKYIGKTNGTLKNRFEQHCRSVAHGRNTYIGNAIHKYGRKNFTIELLDEVVDWVTWERFYIEKYQTTDRDYGYNITSGGDTNPMDSDVARENHRKACNTEEYKEKQRKQATGRKQPPDAVEKTRQRTMANLDYYLQGFREYNKSKQIPVGIVENDVVVKEFESASEACSFCGKPTTEAGRLLRYCDKFNLNGKRSKFFGYSWTRL